MKLVLANLSLPSVAACAIAAGLSAVPTGPARACPYNPYFGAVCTLGTSFCPEGYLPADGRTLSISSNPALYSLLGNRFGGDGRSFNLPDLRGRVPVGIGEFEKKHYFAGSYYGAEATTLTAANLPPHTHKAIFSPGIKQGFYSLSAKLTFHASGVAPTTGGLAPSATTPYIAANTITNGGTMWAAAPQSNLVSVAGLSAKLSRPLTGTVINESAGGSAPVPVVPPQLAVTYCIAVEGDYPPQP